LPETGLVECHERSRGLIATIVVCLELGRRDVADRFHDTVVVQPPDPFEGGELDVLEVGLWSATPDDLSLEETDDRLSQGVVLGVALAANRRLDPGPLPTQGLILPLVGRGFNAAHAGARRLLADSQLR
jgi:hypothetical protein